jgi:hypothetical protein
VAKCFRRLRVSHAFSVFPMRVIVDLRNFAVPNFVETLQPDTSHRLLSLEEWIAEIPLSIRHGKDSIRGALW